MDIIRPGYKRVSEIISILKTFSGIQSDVLDRKRDIGTRTHESIAAYLNCLPNSVDSETEGYFESFLQWYKMVNPEPVIIEKRFYNEEEKITGAIDCGMMLPNEKFITIVDWKTSATHHDPSWAMQAALYNFLVSEYSVRSKTSWDVSPNVLFVKLDKNGKPPVVKKYVIDSDMQEHAMALLSMHELMSKESYTSEDLMEFSVSMASIGNYLGRFSGDAKIYVPTKIGH